MLDNQKITEAGRMNKKGRKVFVIIPALDEERSVACVVNDLPPWLVDEVIVVDNGSVDRTAQRAKDAGATVLNEPARGYGNACLKGIAYIAKRATPKDIVLFIDADYSCFPEEAETVVSPLVNEECEMVIGSRLLGKRQKKSLSSMQLFGIRLATRLMKLLHQVDYSDLSPFRAIQWKQLMELNMQEKNYGWLTEMQLKAARKKIMIKEVVVNHRKRTGNLKTTGTWRGIIAGGCTLLRTIFVY